MLYCPYLSSSLKQCSLIYYVSISLKRAVFAAMSNTGGKCEDWDSVKVAQRVAEGNTIRQKAWCGLYMSVTCPTYFFYAIMPKSAGLFVFVFCFYVCN